MKKSELQKELNELAARLNDANFYGDDWQDVAAVKIDLLALVDKLQGVNIDNEDDYD